jgi:chorismate-pyruvate lyase
MPATPDFTDTSRAMDLLMPLLYFYSQDETPLPLIEFIEGEAVPEPQRHLLVHASDMTPRLREHHGAAIRLEVKEAQLAPEYVMREVVLHRASDGAPVEYGAIGIQLEHLPLPVQQMIRAGQQPLGGILESENIPHHSAPRAYFTLMADEHIGTLLGTAHGTRLYGRCNALTHPDGIVFADIVEILPP